MGVATSIVLFAVGAILRFATTVHSATVHTSTFNIHTIGVILMVVGAVGFVVSLVFWSSWGGFGGRVAAEPGIAARTAPSSKNTEARCIKHRRNGVGHGIDGSRGRGLPPSRLSG